MACFLCEKISARNAQEDDAKNDDSNSLRKMEKQDNIDKLFKDALHGDSSSQAYSESSWKGANALLNRHYRAILLKKVLWISIPVVVGVTALTLFILQDENNAHNSANVAVEVLSTNDTQPSSATEKALSNTQEASFAAESEASDNKAALMDLEEPASKYNALNEEISVANTAPSNNEASNSISAASPAKKSTIKTHTSAIQSGSISATSLANNAENNRTLAPSFDVDENMEWMPTFNIGRLNDIDRTSSVLSRNKPAREALMQKLRRIELGITAGGLVANGFRNTNSSAENPTIGWFGGLTAKFHINARLYAESGFVLNGRSALASRRTESIALLGFIYSSAKNLVYADIPLRVGYNFGARHAVGFGMIFSPLVGYAPYTEATNIIEDPNEENPTITRNGAIARDGFANFDVAGSLNYNFQLTQRIDFTADARFGLFDITDNQYFGTAIIDDRNHQLRIGFNYRFINR
jgi:hypothetical protein